MFARVKNSGKYQYLQIVENRKEKGKVKQRVISTIGRLDQLQAKGRIETLINSLSRFSERTMLILTGNKEAMADAKKIGPALIFERLWERSGIKTAIKKVLNGRSFQFDVERAIFLTVLHRLRYRDLIDFVIDGTSITSSMVSMVWICITFTVPWRFWVKHWPIRPMLLNLHHDASRI